MSYVRLCLSDSQEPGEAEAGLSRILQPPPHREPPRKVIGHSVNCRNRRCLHVSPPRRCPGEARSPPLSGCGLRVRALRLGFFPLVCFSGSQARAARCSSRRRVGPGPQTGLWTSGPARSLHVWRTRWGGEGHGCVSVMSQIDE